MINYLPPEVCSALNEIWNCREGKDTAAENSARPHFLTGKLELKNSFSDKTVAFTTLRIARCTQRHLGTTVASAFPSHRIQSICNFFNANLIRGNYRYTFPFRLVLDWLLSPRHMFVALCPR